jgi:nucleoid-associated protein YgaU
MRKGFLAAVGATLIAGGTYANPVQQPTQAAYAAPSTPPENLAPAPAADASVVTNVPEAADSVAAAPVPPAATIPAPVRPEIASEPAQAPVIDDCHECAPRFWVDGEYLLWWVKNGPQPLPLVTTNSTTPADFSVPGTAIVYGPSHFDYGVFSGGRVTAGYWLDADQRFGIEGRGFLLEQKSTTGFNISGAGNPIFAVPFFDLSPPPSESSFLTSSSTRTGSFAITSSSRLWGAEVNGLYGRRAAKTSASDCWPGSATRTWMRVRACS